MIKKNPYLTYDFMAFHHVVKFLINLLVFLLSTWSENIGGICVRALAASVLLLVQGLYVKTNTGGSTEHMKNISIKTLGTACTCPPSQILHKATF